MKSERVIAYSLVVIGLLAMITVSVLSHRSLEAKREQWVIEQDIAETRQREALAELAEESRTRERELVSTIQKLADQRVEIEERLESTSAGLSASLAAERDRRAHTERTLDALQAEKAALELRRSALEANVASLAEELAARAVESERLQTAVASVQALVEDLGMRVQEAEKSRKAMLEEVLGKIDAFEAGRSELATRVERLTAKLEAALAVLARDDARPDARPERASHQSPSLDDSPIDETPAIECIIGAVHASAGLVVVSAGMEQGIRKGTRLVVYEGSERIATLETVDVFEKYAGCKVLDASRVTEIRKGQRVSSR